METKEAQRMTKGIKEMQREHRGTIKGNNEEANGKQGETNGKQRYTE